LAAPLQSEAEAEAEAVRGRVGTQKGAGFGEVMGVRHVDAGEGVQGESNSGTWADVVWGIEPVDKVEPGANADVEWTGGTAQGDTGRLGVGFGEGEGIDASRFHEEREGDGIAGAELGRVRVVDIVGDTDDATGGTVAEGAVSGVETKGEAPGMGWVSALSWAWASRGVMAASVRMMAAVVTREMGRGTVVLREDLGLFVCYRVHCTAGGGPFPSAGRL